MRVDQGCSCGATFSVSFQVPKSDFELTRQAGRERTDALDLIESFDQAHKACREAAAKLTPTSSGAA